MGAYIYCRCPSWGDVRFAKTPGKEHSFKFLKYIKRGIDVVKLFRFRPGQGWGQKLGLVSFNFYTEDVCCNQAYSRKDSRKYVGHFLSYY